MWLGYVNKTTHVFRNQHGACPVPAVGHLGSRSVGDGGDLGDLSDRIRRGVDELVRLRLVGETGFATRDPSGKTLSGARNREDRGGEEDLTEQSGGEHDSGIKRWWGGVVSNALSEVGV